MADLVGHLETYLGEIAGGWSRDAAGVPMRFQVVRFDDRPDQGLVTYSTLGLSHHVIHLPTKAVRQELVMTVRRRFEGAHIVSLLATVGGWMLERHQALLRGEVLRNGGGIPEGGALASLYAAAPGMLPDAFATMSTTDPPTVFVWLIPVSDEEAGLVATHGWPWFEERLLEQQPDLFDLQRATIIHGQTRVE